MKRCDVELFEAGSRSFTLRPKSKPEISVTASIALDGRKIHYKVTEKIHQIPHDEEGSLEFDLDASGQLHNGVDPLVADLLKLITRACER